MSALGLLMGVALLAVAALHAYWGFGGVWPAKDGATLAHTVVGDPRAKRMPGAALTFAVVAALACAAALAITSGVALWVAVAHASLAIVFLGRGIAGYVPAWRRAHQAQPFARLDVIAYSPFCLALGAGFGWLAASELVSRLHGAAP